MTEAVPHVTHRSDLVSVRPLLHPTERSRLALAVLALALFVLIVVVVLVQASAAGALLQLVALLVLLTASVWGLVQVGRANRLGRSLHVGYETLPELQAIVDDVRRTLDYHKHVEVFVAESGAPISTMNYLGTRVMVLEGGLVGSLLADRKTDQLAFLIGREIGALKARLTRLDIFVVLLNLVNGLKVMAPFLLPYYRATTYSGDQIGMASAGSLDSALEATRRLLVGEKLALSLGAGVVVPQAVLVRRRLLPRFAQLFAAEPHTTNRYGNLICFGRYYDPDAWERVAKTMSVHEAAAFEELWQRSPYSRRPPAAASSPAPTKHAARSSGPVAPTPPLASADEAAERLRRERAAAITDRDASDASSEVPREPSRPQSTTVQHRGVQVVPPVAHAPRSSTRAIVIAVVVTAIVVGGIAAGLLLTRSDDAGSSNVIVDDPGAVGVTPNANTTASGGPEPPVEKKDLPALMLTTDELGPSFTHLSLESEYWLTNSDLANSPDREALIEESGRVTGYNGEFSLADGAEFSEPAPMTLALDLFEQADGASYFLAAETEYEMGVPIDDDAYTLLDSSFWYPTGLGDESTGYVETYDYVAPDGYQTTSYYVGVGFRRDVVVGWAYGWFGENVTAERREQLITEAAQGLLDKIDAALP